MALEYVRQQQQTASAELRGYYEKFAELYEKKYVILHGSGG